MDLNISEIRREYKYSKLSRAELASEPMAQFDRWLKEAFAAELPDPNAMVLSTSDAGLRVDSRVVLLKSFDASGFVFYTNVQSVKAKALAENPKVSLLFFWHLLERQVKILGTARRLPAEAAQAYFKSRPRESQLAAWASPQSEPIASRQDLEQRYEAVKQRFENQAVPFCENWGGYRVVPEHLEFWQGRESRLHDRFCYLRRGEAWEIERLGP